MCGRNRAGQYASRRDVERQTALLHRRELTERERITEQLIELEDRAREILNASQRSLVDNFPPKNRFDKHAGKTHWPARPKTPREQWNDTQERRLDQARQELHELHQERRARTGPSGRFVLHPFGAERVFQNLRTSTPAAVTEAADVLRYGTSEHSSQLIEQQKTRLSQLRNEISNWNLINGLRLSQEQTEEILHMYGLATAPEWGERHRDARSRVRPALRLHLQHRAARGNQHRLRRVRQHRHRTPGLQDPGEPPPPRRLPSCHAKLPGVWR
jgi:AraC-like DNA-binding protein